MIWLYLQGKNPAGKEGEVCAASQEQPLMSVHQEFYIPSVDLLTAQVMWLPTFLFYFILFYFVLLYSVAIVEVMKGVGFTPDIAFPFGGDQAGAEWVISKY